MSRTDLWTRAAEQMRTDPDARWHAVADWLRTEAVLQDEMEPFVELVNVAVRQQSGVKGYLRFGREADGDIAFHSDTNEGATAVALAYLDHEQPEGKRRPRPDRSAILATIRAHIPRNRYDGEGEEIGTHCTCGRWEGDYFADGEAGPFDDHLADEVLSTLGGDLTASEDDGGPEGHRGAPTTTKAVREAMEGTA